MLDTDDYELLQVSRTADDKTIKSAYRRLAMECHPDRNGGCTDAEAKFKAISQAYDCLKDPQKRAMYDRFGKDGSRSSLRKPPIRSIEQKVIGPERKCIREDAPDGSPQEQGSIEVDRDKIAAR